MTQLAESLAEGDFQRSRRLAHTLKGTAATLGIENLAEMAGTLDSLIRASDGVRLRVEDVRP